MAADQELKLKVKQVIVEGLKLKRDPESIADDETLFGGGLSLDSVDILTLVSELEDKFDIQILDDEVQQLNSINDIADFVASKTA